MLHWQEKASTRGLDFNQMGYAEIDTHEGQKYVTKIGERVSQGRDDATNIGI